MKYMHKETKNLYTILHLTKMKHPDTGSWLDAVVYKAEATGIVWVRSSLSFSDNFEVAHDKGYE
jgi:hypothetical protein